MLVFQGSLLGFVGSRSPAAVWPPRSLLGLLPVFRRRARRTEAGNSPAASPPVQDDRAISASLLIRSDWRLEYVDVAAEQLFQRQVEDLIGQSLWEVFPELHDSRTEAVLQLAAQRRINLVFEEPAGINGRPFLIYVKPVGEDLFVSFSAAQPGSNAWLGLVPEGQRYEAHPDQ
jgi:PAS domain-containing protein